MIYTNENGELLEINRHDYVCETQYYSKISEMFKSYIQATERDRTAHVKHRQENLETIEQMVDEFHNKKD
jgi:hypothetical protein